MGRLQNRAALAALGGFALAGAMSIPAGAATGVHVVAGTAAGSQVFSSAVPTTKIKGEGSTATFKPSALTVGEDTSGGDCDETPLPTSFVIKNTGTATAYLDLGGAKPVPLPKAENLDVCVSGGTAGSTATLTMSNKKGTKVYAAKLKITASD